MRWLASVALLSSPQAGVGVRPPPVVVQAVVRVQVAEGVRVPAVVVVVVEAGSGTGSPPD
jgi:hypothetical protein